LHRVQLHIPFTVNYHYIKRTESRPYSVSLLNFSSKNRVSGSRIKMNQEALVYIHVTDLDVSVA